MAGKNTKVTVARTRPVKAAPVAANDQGELSLTDLAKGILSKEVRPRAGDIRRLAEAALTPAPAAGKKAKADKKAKPDVAKKDGGKKKKAKPADAPKDAGKAAAKKDGKKLAKIPGAKTKK